MKRFTHVAFLLFIILSAISCDKSAIDGEWDDNIHLSEKNITISAEANKVLITTKGTSWWIAGILLYDDSDYDISDTDTTQEDFLIETEDFSIERKNTKEIHVSMTQNNTGSERTLTVSLQAGNYFDGFQVHQSAN
ncbi:hypothetical protein SAMN04488007_1425 [Maribacter aquivivus]|uniref:BACON domain-containing protein n=1 Tax=Maribacter aquivivus TaxID=228958 RepID=A0A1M6M523_9FLAO|nr:hypothetical protein [Maribacter aquivivus]SHJ78526.1 hypothetical protein SAMN04488007_1425 [Maribacter aquivivus]